MAGSFIVKVFGRNLLKGNSRRNIFVSYFVFMPDLGYDPGLYLLDYGNFNVKRYESKTLE